VISSSVQGQNSSDKTRDVNKPSALGFGFRVQSLALRTCSSNAIREVSKGLKARERTDVGMNRGVESSVT
jgi:hypothetical protein